MTAVPKSYTILSRIPLEELESLMRGYGWMPHFVEGDDPAILHQTMAATLDQCLCEIRAIQQQSRGSGQAVRGHWPTIVLRTPKGWTGPKEVDGKKVEGFWRAHQVPLSGMHDNPAPLEQLEDWMKSYRPEELFDASGRLVPELKALAPKGTLRMSANPHANGGLLRRGLRMPDFRDYAQPVSKPAQASAMNTKPLGALLRDVMARNMDNFRVFGPDENTSNKLDAVYEVAKKLWLADYRPEDADGGELSPDGRVMEMLSEHTLEGWYEGYVLSGRHGFFATYEAFVHVIDSMYNQHAKWLAICVVDLFRMTPAGEHPHGLSDRDFDSLFTVDRPIIFNFHGYPWLIHRLAYRRTNHRNLHVRGYKERGNINTPLELAIENEIDRFSLAIDVINRVPKLQVAGAHVKERLRDMQIDCRNCAHEHGIDQPDAADWTWPY